MIVQLIAFIIDMILINAVFLIAYLLRYGADIPKPSFIPYKESFIFLTLVIMLALAIMGVFRKRFVSAWDLFKRIFAGLFIGSLLCIAVVYVFRIKWSPLPSSLFAISFPISLLLIATVNYFLFNWRGRIKKNIVIIGDERGKDVLIENGTHVQVMRVKTITDLVNCKDIDEMIICDNICDHENFNLLIYLLQKLKTDIFFVPEIYREMLSDTFNGNGNALFLDTMLGKKNETQEFFIRAIDITVSLASLLLTLPVMVIVAILTRLSSPGPIFFTQERAGKNGETFMLYKFRTMVLDAGLEPVAIDDPRVTKAGRYIRRVRLDELPQLVNVLKGQMSLVGPRPENLMRVERHKALQGIRLAVKPGLTGLAQIRSCYDLHPRHKIKYDYLYIQKRSLLLNLYIMAKTIPVILMKKGQ